METEPSPVSLPFPFRFSFVSARIPYFLPSLLFSSVSLYPHKHTYTYLRAGVYTLECTGTRSKAVDVYERKAHSFPFGAPLSRRSFRRTSCCKATNGERVERGLVLPYRIFDWRLPESL